MSTLRLLLPEGGIDRWEKTKIARCQNQTGLLQHYIRSTQINPKLGLSLQGGSRKHLQSQNCHEAKVDYEPLVGYHDGKVPLEDRNRERDRGSSTGKSALG
jgi:hypothetical protein